MKRVWLILAAFLGLVATAVPASADVVYTLSQHDATFSGSNFGAVTLHDNGSGTSAHVTVTVQLASGYRFGTNSSYAFGWNLTGNPTGVNIAIGAGTDNASRFSVVSYAAVPDFAMSPFSAYNYAIDYNYSLGTVFPSSDDTLVFDVSRPGFGVLSTNFAANAGTFFFGASVATGQNFFVNTYKEAYVAAKQVPEPGAIGMSMMVVASLAGLVMLQRRRKLVSAV